MFIIDFISAPVLKGIVGLVMIPHFERNFFGGVIRKVMIREVPVEMDNILEGAI